MIPEQGRPKGIPGMLKKLVSGAVEAQDQKRLFALATYSSTTKCVTVREIRLSRPPTVVPNTPATNQLSVRLFAYCNVYFAGATTLCDEVPC